MQRRIYRAIIKTGMEEEAVTTLNLAKPRLLDLSNHGSIECPSLFRFNQEIYFYFEFSGLEHCPGDLFIEASAYLESWPGFEGSRKWVPMHDIFHYQAPQNPEEWRRKTKVEKPHGRIIRLKPEMIASYIFYHYQYQEEKPCDGDKYGIIGIHEDVLFFYLEEPTYQEEAAYEGLLKTQNSPKNWGEVMSQHFKKWPDQKYSDDNWRDCEVLLTLY
ncbi:MAG: hypothetical protein H7X94_10560 [Vallitaleaceae bacterium]|nr:hypothetical protein [Vallitaleaceae bacterium]